MNGPPPTKEEAARMARIKQLGCIVAFRLGLGRVECDVHHLRDPGAPQDHMRTVGLNLWSHRGRTFGGLCEAELRGMFGPSLAKEPRRFRAEVGTEEQLLKWQNERLGNLA